MKTMQLALFSITWLAIIYFINCLIARCFISVKFPKLVVYITTVAALGLFGEIAFDTLYKLIMDKPLWQYELLPIHQAFTSFYSLFLWGGIIGFHLYLLHSTLSLKGIKSLHMLAIIFCAEAIILEAMVNLSYLTIFGNYIYYYLPNDLWHITSLQTLPLYLLAGYITVTAIRLAIKLPRHALAGDGLVLITLLMVK